MFVCSFWYSKISFLKGRFEQALNSSDVQEIEKITNSIDDIYVYISKFMEQKMCSLSKKQWENKKIGVVTGETNGNIHNILTDSDIVVLQKNYDYLFWSILAGGAVLVSMNIVKKQ